MKFTFRDPTESYFYALVSPKGIFDENGAFKGSFAVITDITYRKKTEEALKASEEKLAGILNSVTELMIMIDHGQNITWANQKALAFFGSSLVGLSWGDSPPAALDQRLGQLVEDCFAGCESHELEIRTETSGGRALDLWCNITPAGQDEAGRTRFVLVAFRDITVRKALQAEAMRSGHLTAIGELAAGVAHEINNPINGIINYAELLETPGVTPSLQEEIPGRIIQEGERIARIVSSLLAFARAEPDETGGGEPGHGGR